MHYVILCDWAVDHMSDRGVDVIGIAHSLDEAKGMFAKAVIDEKNHAVENDYEIYENSDVEFDAGEDGYYNAEHVRLYIQEVM